MSQIASFYLLKDGQRQELSGGDSTAPARSIWPSGTGVRASWI